MKFSYLYTLFLTSCASPKMVRMVDNNMNPETAINQIVIDKLKGYTAHSICFSNDNFMYDSYCKKEWIISNWGNPDSSYKREGVEYITYNSRYKNMPLIFGYRNSKLAYAEINAEEKEWMHGKNPYILDR